MRARPVILFCCSVFASAPAIAAEATGDEIKAFVSDSTVTGTMQATGGYSEYYAADGSIKGKDYTGKWTIESNSMCFFYEGAEKSCFTLDISGDKVRWLGAGGKVEGDGERVAGDGVK